MIEWFSTFSWIAIAGWIGVLPLLWLAFRFLYSLLEWSLRHHPLYPDELHLRPHFFPITGLLILCAWLGMAYGYFFKTDELLWGGKLLHALAILLVTWFIQRTLLIFKKILFKKFDITVPDNLVARKMRTQVDFVERLTSLVLFIIGISLALLTFENVRAVGTSILASAGIASVVVGLAAQKSIGNLIAGFQIAFTQPIRVDDVVIVRNEWGRVEEITLTYVVVRIWDLRRLVVPISYFLDTPFENWTRKSADILGNVILHLDFSFPVDDLRSEFERILKSDARWSGNVCSMQVVDNSKNSMTVRALMSAANSALAWELRCHVREQLISFVHKKYPECLPKSRLRFDQKEVLVSMPDAFSEEISYPEH